MPVTNVDRLEAMLATVCPSDLEVQSPAERRRLADAAYRVHLLAEQAAGGTPFPAVCRVSIDQIDKLVTALWAIGPETAAQIPPAERRRLAEALEAAHRAAKGSGVLVDLRDGRGRQ